MYVTYTEEHFCGTVYFTKPTLTSASSFRLNSKCDVTLSFNLPKFHAVYYKNSYHCTFDKKNVERKTKFMKIM